MAPLPVLAPMRATASANLPAGDGWAHELKWDGMRVLATIDGDLRLASANSVDVTVRFPELAGLVDHLGGHRAVLDGEVVALDDQARPDFGRLQHRMHLSDPARVAEVRAEVAVTFIVFDLLHLDEHPTLTIPYADRRRLLTNLVEPAGAWTVPEHREGTQAGTDLFGTATHLGLEGVVSKRLDSPYLPGRRSPSWRKVKVRRRQEVVIGGWRPGAGNRGGTIGSLLVGVRDESNGPLRFAGGVGTGFDHRSLLDLETRLGPLATYSCPFEPRHPTLVLNDARWVEPELVAEVAFAEWTGDGRLRHPSFLGLRADKDPAEVVREPDGVPERLGPDTAGPTPHRRRR